MQNQKGVSVIWNYSKLPVEPEWIKKRLNNILLINDHKEEAKKICLGEVTKDFMLRKEGRRSEFGVKRNN